MSPFFFRKTFCEQASDTSDTTRKLKLISFDLLVKSIFVFLSYSEKKAKVNNSPGHSIVPIYTRHISLVHHP